MKNCKECRDNVIGIDTKIPLNDGTYTVPINFDNAATTPPIKAVIEAVNNFAPWYSSIHRGTGYKSKLSSKTYDSARDVVKEFVGANTEDDSVIFVKNTTEALNKLSYRLQSYIGDGIVLSSLMEHHSNDLPWRDKYKIDYIDIDSNGRLIISDLINKLEYYNGNVKLITITGASNVTGNINPIYQIAKIAHKYNAKIVVDGAQLIPHMPINIRPSDKDEYIDFLVFSGHKMYAPFGIGVLVGPTQFFENGSPEYMGGGTIKLVTKDFVSWANLPDKEEAGTPNVIGVVALESAIKFLTKIGIQTIYDHEKFLTNYTLLRLKEVNDIIVYGNANSCYNRVGILTFNIIDIPHNIIAEILSVEYGIAVRNGCFCCQPYVQKLLNVDNSTIEKIKNNCACQLPGMVRISFGFYNLISEIDYFIKAIKHISNNKAYYLEKYSV